MFSRSHPRDNGDWTAARRALMLGAARDVDRARTGEPTDQPADCGPGVTGGTDIRILQHGVAEAAPS